MRVKKSLSDFTKIKTSKKTDDSSPTNNASTEKIGVTLRLDREDWERLHYLSIQERVKIQTLLLEGLNHVFSKRGLAKTK